MMTGIAPGVDGASYAASKPRLQERRSHEFVRVTPRARPDNRREIECPSRVFQVSAHFRPSDDECVRRITVIDNQIGVRFRIALRKITLLARQVAGSVALLYLCGVSAWRQVALQ